MCSLKHSLKFVSYIIFHKVIGNSYEILYSFTKFYTKFLQGYNIFPKSKKGTKKWTFLKMSKFGNPKKVSKNTVFRAVTEML